MEKINEILGKIETSLTKEARIELLEKCEANLQQLNGLITQISEKKQETENSLAGQATEFNFEEYFTVVGEEVNVINEMLTNLIDLTKKLETDRALKQFLLQKLEQIFERISEEASRQFNLSTLEIFNEFVTDLKTEMEQKLIDRIEKELFSIQTGLGEFQKVYDVAGPQFTKIQESLAKMKEKYQDQYQNQLTLLHLESGIVEEFLPKISETTQTLTQNYSALQSEIGSTLSTLQQTPLQLLGNLRDTIQGTETELKAHLEDASKQLEDLSAESQMSRQARDEMIKENIRMKAELDHVSQELERVSGDLQQLAKAKDRKVEMREVLALSMTLLVEVFGAQPHSKLLYLLHGQKADMDRDTLIKASGIAGAAVRKALADLDAAKLVKYDVNTGRVKLLKRIF